MSDVVKYVGSISMHGGGMSMYDSIDESDLRSQYLRSGIKLYDTSGDLRLSLAEDLLEIFRPGGTSSRALLMGYTATYGAAYFYNSGVLTYTIDGNLGESIGYLSRIKNGASSTSAITDGIRMYAMDISAGDSRLRIQSESGTPISLGNNTLSLGTASGGAGRIQSTEHATQGVLSLGASDTCRIDDANSWVFIDNSMILQGTQIMIYNLSTQAPTHIRSWNGYGELLLYNDDDGTGLLSVHINGTGNGIVSCGVVAGWSLVNLSVIGSANSGGHLYFISTTHSTRGNVFLDHTNTTFMRGSDGLLCVQGTGGAGTFIGGWGFSTYYSNDQKIGFTAGSGYGYGDLSNAAGTPTIIFDASIGYIGCDNLVVGGGAPLKGILSATASLNFASTGSDAQSAGLTVAVTGARAGDLVLVEQPSAAWAAGSFFHGRVTADDVVTVYFENSATTRDPASATFRVCVFKFA